MPLPECLSARKGLVYVGVNTLLLLALLGEECIRTRGGWFLTAALGTLLGSWVVLGPYVLRQLPMRETLRSRRALVYFAVAEALLIALLAASGLSGGTLLASVLGTLLALAVCVLPFIMKQLPLPAALENHRALAWLGIVTVLLAAAIPTGGTDYLWSESYPLMLLGLLWPWLMLGCLRYLPVSRRHRAAAACAVSAAYLWLAPWGVDAILKVNGWASSVPYDPLDPYNADLGDWLNPAALGGNIMVTVMALLVLAAAVLTATGFRRRK